MPYPQSGLISEASSLLEQAEAGAKKQLKNSKNLGQTGRFPAATEWELIYSDCVILLGLTYALRYALSALSLAFPVPCGCLLDNPLPFLFLPYADSTAHGSESYYGYLQCLYVPPTT